MGVILTGAFIAEHAEIVDGRLNVTGGVMDWAEVDATRTGLLYLVTLMQAGPDDASLSYRLEVSITDPRGEPHPVVDQDISVDAHPGENRFWVLPMQVEFAGPGRWVFVATIGSTSVSVPVEIRFSEDT